MKSKVGSHFDDYLSNTKLHNLHSLSNKLVGALPKKITDLTNIIIYGPSGIGKYSQCLNIISNYSQSKLKYEKKICIPFNKMVHYIKISDIHFEVDFAILGCNSKLLWHDIYTQIVDILNTRKERSCIIVCKFFEEISNDLLDNFYSYMQSNFNNGVKIKFIIITSSVSFIPDNIINCCYLLALPRPSKTNYKKCIKNMTTENNLHEITNIKIYETDCKNISTPYKMICDEIIKNIINYQNISFCKFRDILYDVFIYNLNIGDSIWYIFNKLGQHKLFTKDKFSRALVVTYTFLRYYNNNYRPIYHLENYFFKLIQIIYDL